MAKFLISAFADEASESLEGQIAALKRNGFHCIEPRNINGGSTIKKTDEELFAIRKQLDEAGISVPSFGSPVGKYQITDDFGPQLEEFRRALRICEILGTKRIRMFSFFLDRSKMAEYRDEVIRRLRIMVEEANQAGIKLCHENEGEIYGETPDDIADLLASVPGLYVAYDPANFVYNYQDPIKGFEASLPAMEYAHIKDCLEGNRVLVPAGAGAAQIKEVLQRIDEHFDGEFVLTLEPHLFVSESYKKFDGKEMRHQFHFESADEAFDYASTALKTILAEIGHPVVDGRA